jgi:F-type H+-transporting ATPase subunit gamma
MASGQERILRRRIKSVQSTKKITRAMELIAASRIVKAQQRVAAARPYSEQITEVIRNLAGAGAGFDHPLLVEREVQTVGHVLLTADRGLAGAYNTNVIRTVERAVSGGQRQSKGYALFVSGKKGVNYFRYRGYDIAADAIGFSETPRYEDARELAREVMERYESGDVDRVELTYTRFLSMGSQRVVTSRLLPLEAKALKEGHGDGPQADYEYEPEPTQILERLLPRYVEARVFAALLDAAASEQAARQRAMKSATDNAEDLIKTLSVIANKLRQASITTEIMEIVGGAEALRQADQKESGVPA